MQIEHIAFNVADPLAMARWYVAHLGFQVKRRTVEPPYIHFLADSSGQVLIEIYGNPAAPVPDYAATPPLTLHLALVSENVAADVGRLVRAGGTADGEITTTSSGDQMAMVRDPWGFCLQLVQRRDALRTP